MKNLVRLALTLALVLGAGPQAWADFSIDQPPTEVPADPGDILILGGAPMVDDGDGVPGAPLTLAVPGLLPVTPYDTDAITFAVPNDPFAPAAGAPPGVLFSIDDGDIGPGAGPPDNAIELFYSPLPPVGVSFPTKATEALLGLLGDPPPIGIDDDVDAYEDRIIPGPPGAYFSPDFDAPAGLDPGDIFITDCLNGSLLYLDDVTQLGIAPNEATFVDIDAISVPDVAPGVCEFDGDGFFDVACGGTDCDDLDPNVFPGAPEICDAKDSDCDLVLPPNEADLDADQYVQCTPYVGGVPGILGGNDCNDSNPNIYPNNANTNCDCVAPTPQGTTEVCTDGQDNDCDGAIDAADPECGGGTCAGSAAASVQATPGEKEGRFLNLLAFLLIPVAAALGIVVFRRRR
jgi:hypothetical protein